MSQPSQSGRTAVAFYAAKGGVGTSVVSAATGVLLARRSPTLIIDLAGDQPYIFGNARESSLSDWLQSESPHPDSLARLESAVVPNLSILAVEGGGCLPRPERLRALAQVLRRDRRNIVVDMGRLAQPGVALIQAMDRSFLVTRPCYLALRAASTGLRPDGVVLLAEPGRPLTAQDVASAVGSPVIVKLQMDPRVARSVDAGLLATRLPRSLHPLESLL